MNKYKIKVNDNKYYVVYSESSENAVKKLRDAQAKRISDDIQSKIDAITNIVRKVMYGAFPRDHGGTFSYRVYPNEVGRTIALIKRAFPGIEIKKWSSNEIEIFKRSLTDSSIFDYQPKEISHSRLEAIPLQARQELQNSKNKEATLLSIEGNIEDIINAAEPSNREELKQRGSKITNDLRRQFRITDNVDRNKIEQVIKSRQFELRRDGDKIQEYIYKGNSEDKKNAFEELAKVLPANVGLGLSGDVLSVSFRDNTIKDDNISEFKKELAKWQDLYINKKLITSSELSEKAKELRQKYNIKDEKLTSESILEKAKSLGGQAKQNGATGVLGISISSPQRSDEFANWLEKNNIHYNSDGRQYYVEIQDSAIKDGKYVINNMNDLKRLFTNFPKGDVDISYGRSGFYYHIRPKADGKVSLGSAGYDGTFNTLKEALEWVVYNFRDLILNVNPDGSNRDSAIKDSYYTESEKKNKQFVKNAIEEMEGYINNWNFLTAKQKRDIGLSREQLKARVAELRQVKDSAIKDDLSKVENIGKFTLWQDEDTKEYYFDATISRSGKKLHPLGTKDINKAREKVKKELEWITDSNIVRDGYDYIGNAMVFKSLPKIGEKAQKYGFGYSNSVISKIEKIYNKDGYQFYRVYCMDEEDYKNNHGTQYYYSVAIKDSKDINEARRIAKEQLDFIEDESIEDGGFQEIGGYWRDLERKNPGISKIYEEFRKTPTFNNWDMKNSMDIIYSENMFNKFKQFYKQKTGKPIKDSAIKDAEELPHISKEKWNKIPNDYKTTDPATGKKQAFAGSLGIAPGGTTLLTEGKHFIIDAENKEKNWTYVMFGTTGEKKVENLTKAEAEHLLKNNKLLGYSGKIYETVRDNTNNTNKILDSDIVVARSLDELISKIKSWDGETTTNYILSPKSSGWYFDYFITMGHKYSYYAYIKKTVHGRHDNPNVDISKQNIDKTVTAKTAQELIDQVVIILK